MAITTVKSAFLTGLRDGLPFVLVAGPFALLFGVVASEAGLPLSQVMGMSVLVIAGAAQFAALQLMLDGSTIPFIVAGALAVNLRMAMYSAALVPHLGPAPLWQRALVSYLNFDQTYAASVARYEDEPHLTVPQKVWFFLGVATPITPTWIAMTWVGAEIGSIIPGHWPLDFALPITFIALIGPMLRTVAHVVAAGVSIAAALALAWMPSGTGLLLAALCAMVAGAATEVWLERRR